MKQFVVLILLLVVTHVEVYAHDSNEKSLSEINRKRLLVNLLHAIRTLRDHKKTKSTRIAFPNTGHVHSGTKHHIGSTTDLVSLITKAIYDTQTTRRENQISKRSKGIHKESAAQESHDKRYRNGKDLYLQLLQTLKSRKKRKNEKRTKTTYLLRNHEKHGTRVKQKSKADPSPLAKAHNRKNIPDFDQRSSTLKPVKQIARLGTSQTNKARYSFSQARLSFLQFLETAQDQKLTKLANLEKKYSDILPKREKSKLQNEGKEVKYALQDFTKYQSATALSHIHQSYKKLFNEPSQNVTPIKHSLLGEPLKKKVNSPIPILKKQKNVPPLSISVAPDKGIKSQRKAMSTPIVDLKSTNKNKTNGILTSMLDELLSISNARSKLEKLKRLRKLQAKLLNHYSEEKTKKQKYDSPLHDNDTKSISLPRRSKNEQKRPITRKIGNSLFNNVPHRRLSNLNKASNYRTSQEGVYGKPSKRYNEHQRVQMDDNNTFSFTGSNSSDKVSYTNEQQVVKHVQEYNFNDFADSTQDKKKPIHSILGSSNLSGLSGKLRLTESPASYLNNTNETVQEEEDKMASLHLDRMPTSGNKNQSHYQHPPGYGHRKITSSPGTISNSGLNKINTAMIQTQPSEQFHNPSQHVITGNGNKPKTSSHGITGNSVPKQTTIEDEFNDTHKNSGHIALLKKQHTKHLDDSGQHAGKHFLHSQDIDSDQSYLPLDSSATPIQTESKDSKSPLASVVSEHDKIISELTSSKTLAKHLLNDKSEKSHKTLSKVLQKAQNMFLKKVKEILAGNKTNEKDRNDTSLFDNKSRDNKSSQKPKEGVINTSAYVMDESPPNAKAANVGQDTSGIVPKTPTNDDLANSVNRNMLSPASLATSPPASPLQNAGTTEPMQSLQTPTDPNPPLLAQPGQGHPVSGQPLTYTQLQDAHEEERVALQQENSFRSMQPGVNAPLNNGANAPLNSATTPYQSYVGSNQLPQANPYSRHNPGIRAPNIDDLSEYRGGMERYQLSHHIGYDGDIGDENEDDYLPRRHHFHLYGHRVADEDNEYDRDYDDDDEDFDEDGEKKSNIIRKPHHGRTHKHLKHDFKNALNYTKIDHTEHEKLQVKPNMNATLNTRKRDR